MDENDVLRLSANRTIISMSLKVDRILDHLLKERILNGELESKILSKTTRYDRVRQLIRILPSCGPEAYSVFRDALAKTGQQHLVVLMENTNIPEERRKRQESEAFGPGYVSDEEFGGKSREQHGVEVPPHYPSVLPLPEMESDDGKSLRSVAEGGELRRASFMSGSDAGGPCGAEGGAQIYSPSDPPVSVSGSDDGASTSLAEGGGQLHPPSEPPVPVSELDVESSTQAESAMDQTHPGSEEGTERDDTITLTLSREDMIPIFDRESATRRPNPNPVALVRDTTGDTCHQLFDDGLVHVCNIHGEFIRGVEISGPNDRPVRPTGMAVTPDGYFIAEQNGVFMCSYDGSFIREITDQITVSRADGGVHGMAYHDGRVYVATPHSIYVISSHDGNRIAELHNPANGPCDLDIFMSDEGLRIYLSDWLHDRVYVLDESGNVVNTFGDSGAGQLSHPKGISVSDDGYCYVADSQHGAVNVYTVSDGQLHHRIQADGRGFGRVIDVVSMADGTIIICTAEGLYVMRP